MRQFLARALAGRSGSDHYNRFLSVCSFIVMFIAILLGKTEAATFFWWLSVLMLVYCYFRMFSRNIEKRRAENYRYLTRRANMVRKYQLFRESWAQRKEYRFFKCPGCGATLRVPRGKGKIRIICRKCGNSFERKT